MSDYETPAAEVWSGSSEDATMGTSGGIGGGGIPLPDVPLG